MENDSSQPEEAATWEAELQRRICAKLGHFFCFVVGKITLALLLGGASALCFSVAITTPRSLPPQDREAAAHFTPFFYLVGAVLALGCAGVLIVFALALWKRSKSSA